MLREMTWSQFLEWRAFDDLEPFGEERSDFRTAQVVQTLWNIHRDPKRNPDGWPLTDFVLAFGDSPYRREEKPAQSPETIELHIDAWVAASNAKFAAKGES